MLGVTALGIFCGLAVSKKEWTAGYAFTVASLMPATVVCVTFMSLAQRRFTVLIVSFIGAAIGALSGLPHRVGHITVWEAIQPVFVPLAIHAAIGAFILGIIAVMSEAPSPPTPKA